MNEITKPLLKVVTLFSCRSPLKVKGHVLFDGCTPNGEIYRHTMARSDFEALPALYRVGRKASWGGLLPAYFQLDERHIRSHGRQLAKDKAKQDDGSDEDEDEAVSDEDDEDEDDAFALDKKGRLVRKQSAADVKRRGRYPDSDEGSDDDEEDEDDDSDEDEENDRESSEFSREIGQVAKKPTPAGRRRIPATTAPAAASTAPSTSKMAKKSEPQPAEKRSVPVSAPQEPTKEEEIEEELALGRQLSQQLERASGRRRPFSFSRKPKSPAAGTDE